MRRRLMNAKIKGNVRVGDEYYRIISGFSVNPSSDMLTFHSIFSLDTLDSRLTARSPSPPKIPPLAQSQRLRAEASPSRWRTPEFWLYYAVFAVAIPWIFKTTYDISKGTIRSTTP